MPRYFFHVRDDSIARDDAGIDLPDLESATGHALAAIREMMAEEVLNRRLQLSHRIEIEDEADRPLLTLLYRDALTIEP